MAAHIAARSTSPDPNKLYTLSDAAEMLRVANASAPHSASGLRAWADQQRIACVRLSDGERVIPGSALLPLVRNDL